MSKIGLRALMARDKENSIWTLLSHYLNNTESQSPASSPAMAREPSTPVVSMLP